MPFRHYHEPRPRDTLNVGGVAINFQASLRDPPGTTLVMIHGFGANLESWNDLCISLAPRYSTVRLDLKGSGFSSKPVEQSYGPGDHAKILHEFLEAMGLRRIVLIGHSLGAAICLITYLRIRGMQSGIEIVGMVIIDGAIYSQRLPFFVAALRNPVTRILVKLLPAAVQVRLVLNYCMAVKSRITPEKVAGYAYFLNRSGAGFALAQAARNIIPPDLDTLAESIAEVDVRTLIIWGREDRVTPLEYGYRLHAAIRRSELLVLADTGHIPHEERPEEVATAILAFLESIT